ncbi:hypothetical protein VOH95_001968 [Clostridium perfringens]|uniref:hypothetical protein n=1 Tax=Clostridium perfringens TaxID=1502 RepID=UPI002A13EFE7|nr:hypothetical protein [Clostridium perfringens]MDK0753864.1 hypothetical protein [Clostridium perfringens]MDK0757031.1 hypothetical protein [Clostridium perfringens]MDK0782037.1 hypothetical protein [Clostridium perfringens]MDK0962954.1 hypothetical protein [Clostridium perfringens]
MRKTLSLLIAIGILSSSFIACGTSSKDITNNESKINNSSNINKDKEESNNETSNKEKDKNSNDLDIFLNGGVLEGNINDNIGVIINLENSYKKDDCIIATEYYTKYPDQSLDVDIKSDGNNKYTINESENGKSTGIYKVTIEGNTVKGTFTNTSTNVKSNVDLEFKKESNEKKSDNENNTDNKINDKNNSNLNNEGNDFIDIKEYKLKPEEAIKLFYKKNPEGLKYQKEIEKYLKDKYGESYVDTFMENQIDVFDNLNISNLEFYMDEPDEDIEPKFFIGNDAIYILYGWANSRMAIYFNKKGDVFIPVDKVLDSFEEGNMYIIKNNKKVKVLNKPHLTLRGISFEN